MKCHTYNIKQFGVARPGKTKKDKANGSQRFHPNRRIWDDKEKRWLKI